MSESIPYKPLPPICTIPVEQRIKPVQVKPKRKPLTGDQLVNWRRFNPLAMYLSDEEINQLRDEIEDAANKV